MISTKGRYSIRILFGPGRAHRSGGYIPMKEVAARAEYLAEIHREADACAEDLPDSLRASTCIGGGYRLAREPETCTLWDILAVLRGEPAPVSCLKDGHQPE